MPQKERTGTGRTVSICVKIGRPSVPKEKTWKERTDSPMNIGLSVRPLSKIMVRFPRNSIQVIPTTYHTNKYQTNNKTPSPIGDRRTRTQNDTLQPRHPSSSCTRCPTRGPCVPDDTRPVPAQGRPSCPYRSSPGNQKRQLQVAYRSRASGPYDHTGLVA